MTEPAPTPDWARRHSLAPEDLNRLNALLAALLAAPSTAEPEPPAETQAPREPAHLQAVRAFTLAHLPDTQDPRDNLKALLSRPAAASRDLLYRRLETVPAAPPPTPGADALVLPMHADPAPATIPVETSSNVAPAKYAAIAVDDRPTYVHLAPFEGGRLTVAGAARRLACAGAVPLAALVSPAPADCRDPELRWQWREASHGLAEGCRAFQVPLLGSSQPLASQSPLDPAPSLALAGWIEQPEHLTTHWFRTEGDTILLLGNLTDPADPLWGLGGSAYLQHVHALRNGSPPPSDLEKEKDLHLALRAFIHSGVIKSAHACAEGGLAVALAESCRQPGPEGVAFMGAQIELNPPPDTPPAPARLDALLFGETPARIVVSVAAVQAAKVLAQAQLLGLSAMRLGSVGGSTLQISAQGQTLVWQASDL